MCNHCETRPVYEFTNQRKLCRTCYVRWFQKKFLYTIRRFEMIRKSDKLFHKSARNFRDVVLKDLLGFYFEKAPVEIVKSSGKADKIVVSSSLDLESEEIVRQIIYGKSSELKAVFPIVNNVIKPLYFFLDKEILLYAKIRKLGVKEVKRKGKIDLFLEGFEENHPEVKHAVVNSLLEIFGKN